jgi:signal transduction histidine kinase
MMDNAAILLVDDQARNLDALEAILDSTGYQLVRATSANDALLALLKGEFAAIVCDIKMPGIGGIELAQMIKGRKRTQHIPILFLTAHLVEETDLLRGYGVGAVDYLSKPINPEILRLKLGVFVELFRKTRALAESNKALAEGITERERAEEALRIAKGELELRVQERTAELLSVNGALRKSEDQMRLAADEMRALKENAENANRAKDHFLAVLSHELRTPLTPVLATVQSLLQSSDMDDDLRESMDIIHRNVELEARLIDDLLDLTRIERGKLELQQSIIDVHQIMQHALRTCEADFRKKDISVRVDLRAESAVVYGDRARLLQVFWNLLKNAAKFTPAGKSVEIRTSNPPEGSLRIELIDTGIGIDAVRLATIFNAFEQGSSAMTRQYGGLGLGLSISKALVELHHGTISASSEGLNQGAAFAVCLPLATGVEAASPVEEANPACGAAKREKTKSPVRLLLVEDHPDTSRVMERLLRGVGYEVTTANDLTSALRAFETTTLPFDIVVSDIGLPDGSGLDLARQLRLRFPGTPAVALSGFGMEEDRRRSAAAGFSAHLTKPVDLTALQSTIQRVMA